MEKNKSNKNWNIKVEDMKELFHWEFPEGCIATDRILVDGCKVGYMYREEPDTDSDMPDSGWRFTAGDESEEYMDNPKNSGIYALNTVANNDPDIIPFLYAPYGSAFIRLASMGVCGKSIYRNTALPYIATYFYPKSSILICLKSTKPPIND